MSSHSLIATSDRAVSIQLINQTEFSQWLETQPEHTRSWLKDTGFDAKPGAFTWLSGTPTSLLVIVSTDKLLEGISHLPERLPAGHYQLAGDFDSTSLQALALGWGLGSYRFDRYKSAAKQPAKIALGSIASKSEKPTEFPKLVLPTGCDETYLRNLLDAISLTRDLINTPASDMLPTQLAAEARALAETFSADLTVTVGDELLNKGFNTIHSVGRASADAPRLIDLTWGDPTHPAVTLVGKGVCFDSGGLDLKNAAGMRLMKKDMGGSAHALGLAHMIMAQHLPVRLRVLVPAVENAVSSNAYRPGDILNTYKGLTVEVDNTDAEGRLVLCDALALASEDKPDLIVDFATLTGAARVALGTELPAMFSNRDDVAQALSAAATETSDPLWRLPLHQAYLPQLESRFADLVNASAGGFGGAITAGLFLQAFVDPEIPWVHFDVMAWNLSSKPAHPEGGEAMGLRAVYRYLEGKYASA